VAALQQWLPPLVGELKVALTGLKGELGQALERIVATLEPVLQRLAALAGRAGDTNPAGKTMTALGAALGHGARDALLVDLTPNQVEGLLARLGSGGPTLLKQMLEADRLTPLEIERLAGPGGGLDPRDLRDLLDKLGADTIKVLLKDLTGQQIGSLVSAIGADVVKALLNGAKLTPLDIEHAVTVFGGVVVKGLFPKLPPEDIRALAGLHDKHAIELFLTRYSKILGKATTPSQQTADVVHKFVIAMARQGGGDVGSANLERGLLEQWSKLNPEDRPPFGVGVGELTGLKSWGQALLSKLHIGKESYTMIKGIDKLINRVDEQCFNPASPLRQLEIGKIETTSDRVTAIRNSLNGLEGEWDAAVAEVGRPGRIGEDILLSVRFLVDGKDAEIDMISDKGMRWTQVKRLKPFGKPPNNMVLTGGEGATYQSVMKQVRLTLRCAEQNKLHGSAPQVVFQFPLGVAKEVAQAIETLEVEGAAGAHAQVEGIIVPDP